MNPDTSILTLVLQASLVVKIVMGILFTTSLASWAAIFHKWFELRRVRITDEHFERDFWSSGQTLNELYGAAGKTPKSDGPMLRVFVAGMREYFKLRERRVTAAPALIDGARRAMRAHCQRELDRVEARLSFLASVGSVSPYVGLFGTVWGIMHAFVGLGNLRQATLASVAPSIAEALVATALGLFAAIPAVLAYNRFAREAERAALRLETFMEEFSNILHRNIPAAAP